MDLQKHQQAREQKTIRCTSGHMLHAIIDDAIVVSAVVSHVIGHVRITFGSNRGGLLISGQLDSALGAASVWLVFDVLLASACRACKSHSNSRWVCDRSTDGTHSGLQTETESRGINAGGYIAESPSPWELIL